MECYSRPLMSHFFVLHTSNDPNDPIEPAAMRIAIGSVGLRGWTPPGTKGTCVIFQKNPHLYIYLLTTRLPVATKLVLQIRQILGSSELRAIPLTHTPFQHHTIFSSGSTA